MANSALKRKKEERTFPKAAINTKQPKGPKRGEKGGNMKRYSLIK